MAIQKYQPLNLLDQLQREISNAFNLPAVATNFGIKEWSPAVDIKETEDKFVIHADLPGVKTNDIEVTAENGVLTIKGERESKKEEEKDDYKRVERFSGSFMRRFTLPTSADLDKISAKSKDGVLELSIPKLEEHAKPKRIDIKVEK